MVNLYNDAYFPDRKTPIILWQLRMDSIPELVDLPLTGRVFLASTRDADGDQIVGATSDQIYEFIAIKGSGFSSDLSGEYATPEIELDRIRLEATDGWGSVENYWRDNLGRTDDVPWVGTLVFRLKIMLEDVAGTNANRYLIERYIVESVLEKTATTLRLKLTPSLAMDADNVLDRKLSSGFCTLRYRIPKTDISTADFHYSTLEHGGCPYGQDISVVDGTAYFDVLGTTQADWKLDYCGKRITDCVARFDPGSVGNALPFNGTLRAGTRGTETS